MFCVRFIMNTILICTFLFILTLMSAEAKTFADVYDSYLKLEHVHEETCLKENNLSEAMISALVESISKNGVLPDKREYKCFLNCMLVKSKCINEQGELILDNTKEQSKAIEVTFLEKFMRDCTSKITEKDPCEKGARVEMCFSEEVKRQLKEQRKK